MDNTYVDLDEYGFVSHVYMTATPNLGAKVPPPTVNFSELFDKAYYYLQDVWYSLGTRPEGYDLDKVNRVWYYNLTNGKNRQWASIKASRQKSEYQGFTWEGSTFDSDPSSQARINGAVTLALIAKQTGQPYEITWTLKDSTLRTLSADEMIAVGLALGTHVQTIFNKGQQLQQQINEATTKEEVESITW